MSKASDPYFPIEREGCIGDDRIFPGITIREAFILAAMQGLASSVGSAEDWVSDEAIQIAEATMRAAGITP